MKQRAASEGFTPERASGGERECARGGALVGLYPPELPTSPGRRLGFGGAGRVLGRLARGLRLVGPGGEAGEAGVEGLHQVDDMGLWLIWWGWGDILDLHYAYVGRVVRISGM